MTTKAVLGSALTGKFVQNGEIEVTLEEISHKQTNLSKMKNELFLLLCSSLQQYKRLAYAV